MPPTTSPHTLQCPQPVHHCTINNAGINTCVMYPLPKTPSNPLVITLMVIQATQLHSAIHTPLQLYQKLLWLLKVSAALMLLISLYSHASLMYYPNDLF